MINAFDLFCGGGGSSWGAKLAGARIVGGIDADELAARTFKANFPDALVSNRTLRASSRPNKGEATLKVDLLLASPECTNHSNAKGAAPRSEQSRRTADYVLAFAQHWKTRWIVLENVVQMRNWRGYDPLIGALQRAGYRVRPQVLNSSSFGVPQTRRRLFILADRRREPPEIKPPNPEVGTVSEILEDRWPSGPLTSDRRAKPTLERAERAINALGRGVPFLIVYYGSDGSGGWQPLDRPIRTLTTLDRFGLVTWKDDKPMLRMLQVDELRRAMGFCADYKLVEGSRRERIRLLGNGVCPPVMRSVVEQLTAASHPAEVASAKAAVGDLGCNSLDPPAA